MGVTTREFIAASTVIGSEWNDSILSTLKTAVIEEFDCTVFAPSGREGSQTKLRNEARYGQDDLYR